MTQADLSASRHAVADNPPRFIMEVARAFLADECPQRAAAFAFYMVFAIPATMVLVLLLGGLVVGEDTIQRQMVNQASRMLGSELERPVEDFIAGAREQANFNLSAATGIGALLTGAVGAVVQLQSTLNTIWSVRARQEHRGLRHAVLRRGFPIGLLLMGLFLGLVVLMMTTTSVGVTADVAPGLDSEVARGALIALNALLSFALLSLVFTAMFTLLPDAKLRMNDVWLGGVATALLFIAGQFVIAFWLGRSTVTTPFGAAGSLVIVLLWIYYSGMIIFAGAELTRVLAKWRGQDIEPEDYAEKIEVHSDPHGNAARSSSDSR